MLAGSALPFAVALAAAASAVCLAAGAKGWAEGCVGAAGDPPRVFADVEAGSVLLAASV